MTPTNTVKGWLQECMFFYNKSLKENVDFYDADPAKFFWIQYQNAPNYALQIRGQNVEPEKRKSIEHQVLHWFASLPDKYDEVANENEFAFAFCYLFTNYLLGIIETQMVWEVLSYITKHWDEVESMVVFPKDIEGL